MLGVHFNQKMKLSWLKCTADFNYLTETTEKKDRRGRIRRSWMGWHVSGAEQEYSLGGMKTLASRGALIRGGGTSLGEPNLGVHLNRSWFCEISSRTYSHVNTEKSETHESRDQRGKTRPDPVRPSRIRKNKSTRPRKRRRGLICWGRLRLDLAALGGGGGGGGGC